MAAKRRPKVDPQAVGFEAISIGIAANLSSRARVYLDSISLISSSRLIIPNPIYPIVISFLTYIISQTPKKK